MLYLLLKQIFGALCSKKEVALMAGRWGGIPEVQGWMGVLFFRSQWDVGRESADGVKQKLAGRPASDLRATLALYPRTLDPLLSFPPPSQAPSQDGPLVKHNGPGTPSSSLSHSCSLERSG